MFRKSMIAALLALALLLSACQGSSTQAPQQAAVPAAEKGYKDISVSELQTMLEKKDFTFVNVHIPYEGDIAQTDLSIPYDKIDQQLDELPAQKDAKIVLYCRSGRMSAIAGETLAKLGYTNVFNLDGGMVAWEAAGLPIQGR